MTLHTPFSTPSLLYRIASACRHSAPTDASEQHRRADKTQAASPLHFAICGLLSLAVPRRTLPHAAAAQRLTASRRSAHLSSGSTYHAVIAARLSTIALLRFTMPPSQSQHRNVDVYHSCPAARRLSRFPFFTTLCRTTHCAGQPWFHFT